MISYSFQVKNLKIDVELKKTKTSLACKGCVFETKEGPCHYEKIMKTDLEKGCNLGFIYKQKVR